MQFSSVSPTLRFSFISQGERDTLLSRLTEGQTLQGRVVEDLSDGRWALRFLGHTLVAESRLNLAKGQIVDAHVQDLGPPLVLSIAGRPESEGEAVGNALQRLGLPADTTHRAILAALVREGIPITRESVLELAKFLRQLEGQNLDALELDDLIGRVLLLRSRGVPVTPGAVSAFYASAPSAILGGLIEQLGDLLKAEARRLKIDAALSEAIDRLRAGMPDANGLNGQSLKKWIAGLGLDIEHRLTRSANGGLETPTLRGLLGQLGAEVGDGTAGDVIDRAIRLLDTLRLSALPGQDGEDLKIQIPLAFGTEQATVDLSLSRQGGGEQATVSPAHCTLTLHVTLSQLGEVQATLTRHGDRSSCHLTVMDEERAGWLEQAGDELTEGLRKSGLNVGSIVVRSTPKQDEVARVGIDLKV